MSNDISPGGVFRCPDGLDRIVAAGDEIPEGWTLIAEQPEVAGVTTADLQAAHREITNRETEIATKEAAMRAEIETKQAEFDARSAELDDRETEIATKEADLTERLAAAEAAKDGPANKAVKAPPKRAG